MNICVLGGTGFVGTELVTRLVYAGHWVRVPTRSLAHADRLRVLDTAELRRVNVHDPRVLSQLFADCAVVINLIGILNEHGRDTFETVHAALAGKVMSAARATGVRRVLHMSSLGAAEHAPSRYLRSKAAAEAAVRAVPHPEQAHPAVTIFRPSVIFGAGDSLTNRFAGLLRLSAGILPLARVQAAVMGLLPGKPFSLDNFRSLTLDCVCREDGCAALGIVPRPLLAELSRPERHARLCTPETTATD